MREEDLHGKPFALVLIADKGGDDDWGMYRGVLRRDDDGLFFVQAGKKILEIRQEWLEHVQVVEESIKDILDDAQFVLRVRVDALPE